MRVLGASVLTMESFVMGFALLLAMKDHGSSLIFGGLIALATLLCAGLLKRRSGWILGSLLQVAILGYGLVVTPMYFLGALFAVLWICAIYFGRKGEAARAAHLASRTPPTQ